MAEAGRFDVFLSHYSRDKPKVEWIAGELAKDGLRPFLDKWHIAAGDEFQDELVEAMQQSDTAAVFVGPHGMGPWHHEEIRVLLDRAARDNADFRLIPVILPDADLSTLDPFLGQRSWVDFRVGDEAEAIKHLAAGIRGEAADIEGFELPDEPAPYRGLRRFEIDDQKMFFGRDAEITQLIAKLDASSFVAVVGASGSGKSSLVRAGLLPQLSKVQTTVAAEWRQLVCTPGVDPARNLAQQVATMAAGGSTVQVVDELTERLRTRDDGLVTALEHYNSADPRPVLVFIDQFEELFTMGSGTPAEARTAAARFVANLASAAQSELVKVVVTMRADFVATALLVPGVDQLLQDRQIMLGPLAGEGLRQAIVGPAERVGAMFEKGLVATTLDDVQAEPGALPLLQHALHELWLARKGPWLTIDAYAESGGVVGALAKRAQTTYDELTPTQQEIARKIFVRLVTLGEGVPDTRRRVKPGDLYTGASGADEVDAVIDALASDRARLIVVGSETIEVAHEAIVREWDLYGEWLNSDREALREHERIRRRADEWMTAGGELLRGGDVSRAQDFATKHGDDLNKRESLLIEMSVVEADRELVTAKKRSAELRGRLILAIVALVAAVVASVFAGVFGVRANTDRNNATQLADEANARALAQSSEALLEDDAELAIMLALEASKVSEVPEAHLALSNALSFSWRRTFATDQRPIDSIDWSPDGSLLVIGSSSRAELRGVADDSVRELPGHEGAVRGATFSTDGTLIATGDWGGVARIWSVDGGLIHRLEHQGRLLESVQFSPDGQQLLTEGQGWAQIWDLDGGVPSVAWSADAIESASWTPDGRYLVTVSTADYGTGNFSIPRSTITVQDGQTGGANQWVVRGGFQDPVAVSPTDNLIAANDGSGTATLYDLEGNPTASFNLSLNTFATFDRLGGQLVTRNDEDGTAVVVGIVEGVVKPLRNSFNNLVGVQGAAFSPGGEQLVTADVEGVTLWDLSGALRIEGHGQAPEDCQLQPDPRPGEFPLAVTDDWNSVNSVAYSPNGDLIATAGDDCTIRLWDSAWQASGAPRATPAIVYSVAFSPDGLQLVSTSADRAGRIWNMSGGPPMQFGAEAGIVSARFTEEGDEIVAVDPDGDVWRWTREGARIGQVDLGTERAQLTIDGAHVVTTDDDDVTRVRRSEDGDLVAELAGDNVAAFFAVVDTDTDTIVTSDFSSELLVWNTSGELRGQLSGGSNSGRVVVSPDGARLAGLNGDEVWEWDVDGNLLAIHRGGLHISSATYSPDSSEIVAAADEGMILQFATPTIDEMQADATERLAGRVFIADECARYAVPSCAVDLDIADD